jgi:hypothetical protein
MEEEKLIERGDYVLVWVNSNNIHADGCIDGFDYSFATQKDLGEIVNYVHRKSRT